MSKRTRESIQAALGTGKGREKLFIYNNLVIYDTLTFPLQEQDKESWGQSEAFLMTPTYRKLQWHKINGYINCKAPSTRKCYTAGI